MVKENNCNDAINKGESLKGNFDDLKVGVTINVSSDDNSSDLEFLSTMAKERVAQKNSIKLFADEDDNISTKPNSPALNTSADELGKLSTKPNSPILNTCVDKLNQLSTKPISPTLNRCAEETANHHESQGIKMLRHSHTIV